VAHLQDERIEALAWGDLTGEALLEAEDHLSTCGSCKSRFFKIQEGIPTDQGRTRTDRRVDSGSTTDRHSTAGEVTGENDVAEAMAFEATRVKAPAPRAPTPSPPSPRRPAPRAPPPPDPARDELAPGTTVGRYVILRPLAAGSSGRVYMAVDPSLDRKVALKLLPLEHGAGHTAAESRVLREAHAMARVSHPNVVAIHDVGTFRDSVFLAMELVEGPTLRKWMRGKRRPLREVLDLLIAAGRGLEAAHAAGLVHRDFKPANVLIGADGRVRVSDFGLARALAPDAGRGGPQGDHQKGPLEMTLTHAGAVMGTPGYAAPEIVVSGAAADARSDQFSYAATLHEALFGATPYPGDDFGLYFRSLAERKRAKVKTGGVPRAVRRVVDRALRLKPGDRYESMTELLAELQRATVRRRWGQRVLALLLLAAVTGGSVFASYRADEHRRKVCRDAGGRLERIWGPEAKAAIERAFLASKFRFAREALDIVTAGLDEYGRKWARARTAACESTWVRGQASSDEFIRRVGCLDRQLDELDALVAELSRATREVVASSPKAAAQLPPPEQCAREVEQVRAAAAQDEATLERLRAVRGELARAKAQRALGRYAQGLEVAGPASAEARKIGDRATLAEALTLEASLQQKVGEAKRARELAEEAVWVALGGAEDALAAGALVQVAAANNLAGDMEAAKRTLRQLDELSARLPANPEQEAVMENIRGSIASSERRFEDARRHYERSIAAFEQAVGPDDLQTINPVYNLGSLFTVMDQPEKALPHFQRSLQVDQKVLGPNHPDTAWSAAAVAECLARLGQLEEARQTLRGALTVHEETLGPDHFLTGQDLYWLGELELDLGNVDEAMALLTRALAIHRRVGNPGFTAGVEESVGRAQLRKRQFAEALQSFERARALMPDGPDGANAVGAMAGAANALLGLGKRPQALELAERAAGVAGASPVDQAEARWALAQALDAGGRNRPRARELALAARQGFQRPGTPRAQLAAVDAWLAKRGGPAE
jgi:tetratricopeptide (TPR) repeat protein